MYSLYPDVVPKIKKTIKKLGLTDVSSDPKKLIGKRKRFFRTFAKNKNGKKVFLKTILAKEKGIKNRFLNEINFHLTLKENPKNLLFNLVPKILAFSVNKSFPYILEEFLAGEFKKNEDNFSKKDIKRIVGLLKIITKSPTDIFKLIPEKPFFNFAFYKKRIGLLLKEACIETKTKKRIEKFVEQNKKIFYKIKPSLTHGDFSEANLVFFKNKIKIIDWEHIHLRSPIYDFVEFWIKRRRNSEEQKILIEEYLKGVKEKRFSRKLFKLAILEICLRDLTLFRQTIEGLKKNKKFEKIKKEINKEKQNYLKIIKKYVFGK